MALHSVGQVSSAMKAARKSGDFKGFQSGGVVNMSRSSNKLDTRMQTAQDSFNKNVAAGGSNDPIIITKPSSSKGGSSTVVMPSPTRKMPSLPDDCAASFTSDYTYDVNLGGY